MRRNLPRRGEFSTYSELRSGARRIRGSHLVGTEPRTKPESDYTSSVFELNRGPQNGALSSAHFGLIIHKYLPGRHLRGSPHREMMQHIET